MEYETFEETDLQNGSTIKELPDCWSFSLLVSHYESSSPETILTMKSNARECLSLTDTDNSLACRIYTVAMEQPICLVIPWKDSTGMGTMISNDCPEHEIIVTYRPYHISLRCDGILMDEDWLSDLSPQRRKPMPDVLFSGNWCSGPMEHCLWGP